LRAGFEGGDPGGLLGARLFDDLVDRGGEVLVQFVGRPETAAAATARLQAR
jgi:hypothetical protein